MDLKGANVEHRGQPASQPLLVEFETPVHMPPPILPVEPILPEGSRTVTANDRDHPAPPGVDTSAAHSARIYDWWLGGKDNFPADRAMGEGARDDVPSGELVVPPAEVNWRGVGSVAPGRS